MNAILSEKGQVTIPKEARDLMDLRPGVVLRFEVEGGRLSRPRKRRVIPSPSGGDAAACPLR
ncbi:MAG: AbrB/MazE/SpoVT family DNA-binding domain-containing protein [Kiritimatiellia bacterium]